MEIDFASIIIALLLGAPLTIFSKDIRAKIISLYMNRKYKSAEAYNKKIDEKIATLKRLQNPSCAIGYIGGDILITLLLLTLTFFFGFNLSLKANILPSAIGFFGFWYWAVIHTAMSVDTAYSVSRGDGRIEWLKKSKK